MTGLGHLLQGLTKRYCNETASFFLSTRICWKHRAMPKLIKYVSLVWLIGNSLAIWPSENIVLHKWEIFFAELAEQLRLYTSIPTQFWHFVFPQNFWFIDTVKSYRELPKRLASMPITTGWTTWTYLGWKKHVTG